MAKAQPQRRRRAAVAMAVTANIHRRREKTRGGSGQTEWRGDRIRVETGDRATRLRLSLRDSRKNGLFTSHCIDYRTKGRDI